MQAVARNRVTSTVDPEARNRHQSRSRRFVGYESHVSIDADSEIIDDVTVTPANPADQDAVEDLLAPCDGLDDKPDVMATPPMPARIYVSVSTGRDSVSSRKFRRLEP